MDFNDAARLFETARNPRAGKPLANNTRLHKVGDDYAVRLHQTDVVTLHPDGSFTLDSGGWQTLTTKDRINSYMPVNATLWQEKKEWHLTLPHVDPDPFGTIDWTAPDRDEKLREARKIYREVRDRHTVPYFDGMHISAQGNVLNGPSPEAWQAYRTALDAYRKALRKYCALVVRELRKGLPMPSGGDCWGCAMREVGTGAEVFGVDHLRSHFDDNYVVPSLLVNALREVGYRDMGIYHWLDMDADAGTMGGKPQGDYSTVERAVRKYMDRRIRPMPPTPDDEQREGIVPGRTPDGYYNVATA